MNDIRFIDIQQNTEINTYIESGNAVLGELGYTDHSKAHAAKVAHNAGLILSELGLMKNRLSWQGFPAICTTSATRSTGTTTRTAAR